MLKRGKEVRKRGCKKEAELIKQHGKLYSTQLGINLASKKESELFKWFLASILFGKRIGENIAAKTYGEFVKANVLTPKAILDAGWDRLVEILDEGGYVRYDFSTATKLLDISKELLNKYGSLTKLKENSKNEHEIANKLLEFKGVGPVTVNIFLREMRTIWPVDPEPLPIVNETAKRFGISLKGVNRKSMRFIKLEAALIRLRKKMKERQNTSEMLTFAS